MTSITNSTMIRKSRLVRRVRVKTVNVEATKKRRGRYTKHLASAEYKTARREAMNRANRSCEYLIDAVSVADACGYGPKNVYMPVKCGRTEKLHAHHLKYPKSRPLCADDLQILCEAHHRLVEATEHPTRHARRRSVG